MYIVTITFPYLFLSLFWSRFSLKNRTAIIAALNVFLAFSLTAFYLNGDDWANYYYNFFSEGTAGGFELGFYFLFNFIRIISLNNFGFTILIFYLFVFYLTSHAIKRIKGANVPLFYMFSLISLGNTLYFEQLRQLAAVSVVLLSLSYLLEGKQKISLVLIAIASSFHISAIIIIPAYMLLKFKSTKLYLHSVLVGGILVIISFKTLIYFLSFFSMSSFVLKKIEVYSEITSSNIYIGPVGLLSIIIVAIFFTKTKSIFEGQGKEDGFLLRFIFFGCTLNIVSIFIPFISRLNIYFVEMLFVFCARAFFKDRSILIIYKHNVPLLFFVILLVSSSFISYYKNPLAPFNIWQFNTDLVNILTGDIYYQSRIRNIYDENYRLLQEYKSNQGA